MSVILNNGNSGGKHVTGSVEAGLLAGLVGSDCYVLDTGEKMECVMQDANTARIKSGDLIMFGRHVHIPHGSYEDVTITSGVTGYNQKTIVCAKYTMDTSTTANLEDVEFVAIDGERVAGTASDPEISDASILDGATTAYAPLYRITKTGVSVGEPERIIDISPTATGLWETVNQLGQTSSYDLVASKVTVSKANHVCMLSFADGSYTCAAGATLFTLADGYKPIAKADFKDTYSGKRIVIDIDGGIYPRDALSNTILRGSCTWISV